MVEVNIHQILAKLEGTDGSMLFDFKETIRTLNESGYYFCNLFQTENETWRCNFWTYDDAGKTKKCFQFGDGPTISEAISNAILKLKYPASAAAGISPTSSAKIEEFLNG